MKVAILSDTHIRKGRSLPAYVWNVLSDVDTILHAGDFVTESLLEELKELAPVVAVRGNCDWLIEGLPDRAVFTLEHLKIGMTHGFQGKGKNTPERAYNTFQEDKTDIIIFGHSHVPYMNIVNGVLLFNPGSTTERRGQEYYSMGIMTIEKDDFDIRHIKF